MSTRRSTSTPTVGPVLMRRQEAAAYLAVSHMTIERMRRDGIIAAVLIGRDSIRYRKADLDVYLADPEREREARAREGAGRLQRHPEPSR